jgi:hypothetical protein
MWSTGPGIKPTIYRTPSGHANHYTTDVVYRTGDKIHNFEFI